MTARSRAMSTPPLKSGMPDRSGLPFESPQPMSKRARKNVFFTARILLLPEADGAGNPSIGGQLEKVGSAADRRPVLLGHPVAQHGALTLLRIALAAQLHPRHVDLRGTQVRGEVVTS